MERFMNFLQPALLLGLLALAMLARTHYTEDGKAAPWYKQGLSRTHYTPQGRKLFWLIVILAVLLVTSYAIDFMQGFADGVERARESTG